MDLISKTAETDRLNPLVFKKREGLLELLPMHTQSAMASRAAMTVYGIQVSSSGFPRSPHWEIICCFPSGYGGANRLQIPLKERM